MTRLLIAGAGIVVSALVAVPAQVPAVVPLTAADYVEIETSYGRSLHDLSGRGTRHWLTNLAIDPSPTGALGWAYVVEGRGLEFLKGALYQDQWVKTDDRWRLRQRKVHPGTAMPPRARYVAPSNVGEAAFTARDYFEAKHVLWRYNLGYDNAAPYDAGVLSSLSFTHDALFERLGIGDSKGREQLVAFAKERQTAGGTHHWDTNLLFDLREGALDTFSYLMTFTVPASGSPVRIGAGRGPLVHRFVRTPEGWLIAHRRYEPVAAKREIAWPGTEFGLSATELADGRAERARGGFLNPSDYVHIEQLYARATAAFDSGREQGAAFARAFADGGTLVRGGVTTSGPGALTALAAGNRAGVSTWLSNLVVEPTGNGARGRAYVLVKGPDPATAVVDVGTFDDELVRTSDGWRFRTRRYVSLINAPGE